VVKIGDPLPDPGRQAWICPRCNKVNAPHVDACDCPSVNVVPSVFGAEPPLEAGTWTLDLIGATDILSDPTGNA
jgi:hypothetical protein